SITSGSSLPVVSVSDPAAAVPSAGSRSNRSSGGACVVFPDCAISGREGCCDRGGAAGAGGSSQANVGASLGGGVAAAGVEAAAPAGSAVPNGSNPVSGGALGNGGSSAGGVEAGAAETSACVSVQLSSTGRFASLPAAVP